MIDDIRPSRFSPKNKPPIEQKEQPDEPPAMVEQTPVESSAQLDELFHNDEGALGFSKPNDSEHSTPKPRTKKTDKDKPRGRFKQLGMKLWPSTKKQWIIGSIVMVVLIFGGSVGAFALYSHFKKPLPQEPTPVVQKEEPPKPTTEPSKLTGVMVDPDLNKRPVTGIMIENSPDARPQSGLKDAGIVFEAIAEGGITRFLTLFQESQPDYIGPVRSVRPYYAELAAGFDASITHAGGSADGLARVKSLGLKDIDHGANGGAFQRVSNRYAPHNLYTSMSQLDQVSQSRNFTTSNFTSILRAEKEEASAAPTAKTIDFSISGVLYNPHYDYDAASNSYLRVMNGRPHTDERSGQQLAPKVVVALVTNYSRNGIYSVYQTTGSGQVFVFQNGIAHKGTWTRNAVTDTYSFKNEAGQPLPLNAGQTWFTLVANPGAVKFAP